MKKFWDNSCGADTPVRQEVSLRHVPSTLKIGTVTISPATVLAPMAGVTDTVFRRFIRNLGGCGLIMTEFTSADGVLRKKDQKAKRYLHFYEDEHPISAQLFGSNPQVMAEAARMVEDLGFDLVDLNLGCPAKKVVKCNGGSGLLRDLPAIGKIFEAVRAAVTIPFTVKFRAGWNEQEIVCVELARMAGVLRAGGSGASRAHAGAGIQRQCPLGVDRRGEGRRQDSGDRQRRHPFARRCLRYGHANRLRRRDDRPHGPVESVDFPADRAVLHLRESKPMFRGGRIRPSGRAKLDSFRAADQSNGRESAWSSASPDEGVRGSMGIPASTRTLYDHPTEADRYEMIRTYFRMLIEEELPDAVGKMKQFASWFTHGVPGGAGLRKEIYESKSAPEILSRVEVFFEARLDLCGAGALAREG